MIIKLDRFMFFMAAFSLSGAQVAPSFTTENGIVRVQIRHPSSPLFPKPIGCWATELKQVTGWPGFVDHEIL